MQLSKRNALIIGLVLSMITWGISWPSAKILSTYGKPLEIAFLRFVFTFGGVGILLKMFHVPLHLNKSGFRSLIMASFCMAIYSMLFFNGIKHGMPGAGGVLVTVTSPLVTFLLGSILVKRTWKRNEKLGLGIGLLAGIFLLQLWSKYDQLLESGNLYFLASTLVWAILSQFTAASSKYGSSLAFSLWMYLLCIFWLATVVDFSNIIQIVQKGDFRFWFNILFNAVINTGLATTIFFLGTSQLGAEKTSSFIYIVPFAASISSYLFLNEIIHWNTMVGGALGLLAVWMINKKSKPKQEAVA